MRLSPGIAALAVGSLAAAGCQHHVALTPASQGVKVVARTGFNQPQDIVYDSVADVYLVSNAGPGNPTARDNNGFISRVASDGRVLDPQWISSAHIGVALDGPKGMVIRGDTLVVADVGAVRFFNRRTGMPRATITIPGTDVSDVAYGPDGTLWITDNGPDRSRTPVDSTRDPDTVWELAKDSPLVTVARGLSLEGPGNILVDSTSVLVTTSAGDHIKRIGAKDRAVQIAATLPGKRVDGLCRMPDGSLLATTWDSTGTVWHLDRNLSPEPLVTGIASPSGVALDTRHHRVAVTSLKDNQLYLVPLP
jgi:hypothetical protein